MQIATLVMDVQPPRAGRFKKTFRNIVPARRAYYGMRDGLATATAPLNMDPLGVTGWFYNQPVPWSMIWRSAIPGFAHLYAGQMWRARLIFFGFIACLLPAALLFGTTFASVMLGLAFSIHTSAAFDTYLQYQSSRDFRQLMIGSIKVTLLLLILVYMPAAWFVGRGATVRTLRTSFGDFRRGDVIWVNPSLHIGPYPAVGQSVLYEIPEQQVEQTRNGHTIRLYQGERIDRVLAVAGDQVTWSAGELTINGKPSRYLPANPASLPPQMSFTVPENSVLILPTTFPDLNPGSAMSLWESMSCVPLDHIVGTVYFRSLPASRMGLIH